MYSPKGVLAATRGVLITEGLRPDRYESPSFGIPLAATGLVRRIAPRRLIEPDQGPQGCCKQSAGLLINRRDVSLQNTCLRTDQAGFYRL
jgi:hypothetical protein